MEARVKRTGEVVYVYYEGKRGTAMTNMYREVGTGFGRIFSEYEIEFISPDKVQEERHWEDLRERAAIAALHGKLSNQAYRGEIEDFAKDAVDIADALIQQLRGSDMKQEQEEHNHEEKDSTTDIR